MPTATADPAASHAIPSADARRNRGSARPADSSQGVAARRAAATALHAVTTQGQALDAVLPRLTGDFSAPDRALARALASQALRHLPGIDGLIDSATQRALPFDSRARQVLRIALAGRFCLNTPPHAVVATALPLLEGGPRRLAHGVLSTIFSRHERLPATTIPEPHASRWLQAWGSDVVAHAAASLAAIPLTDLALRDGTDKAVLAEQLGATSLFDGHLRLPDGQDITGLAGFATGQWWVQDAAAQLPARLLAPVPGERILDLCAAPGGKTMQLAAAGARVTALDINGPRLRLLRQNLSRTSLSAEIVEADALQWHPEQPFDAILLDAPCSASGTFRRHPDVLYRAAGQPLDRLVALQASLLTRAARWLKPGGRLVYAVCSLEPAEGAPPTPPELQRDPAAPGTLPPGLAPTSDGDVHTLPGLWQGQGGADGFQIRRYRRPA